MLDPNPFAGWLSSNPFGGSWVTVAQSRSPLIGPPFVNGSLEGEDPDLGGQSLKDIASTVESAVEQAEQVPAR